MRGCGSLLNAFDAAADICFSFWHGAFCTDRIGNG